MAGPQLGDPAWGRDAASIKSAVPQASDGPRQFYSLSHPATPPLLAMSPAKIIAQGEQPFPDTNLRIMGIGSQYPEHVCSTEEFNSFVLRNYARTPLYVSTLLSPLTVV